EAPGCDAHRPNARLQPLHPYSVGRRQPLNRPSVLPVDTQVIIEARIEKDGIVSDDHGIGHARTILNLLDVPERIEVADLARILVLDAYLDVVRPGDIGNRGVVIMVDYLSHSPGRRIPLNASIDVHC